MRGAPKPAPPPLPAPSAESERGAPASDVPEIPPPDLDANAFRSAAAGSDENWYIWSEWWTQQVAWGADDQPVYTLTASRDTWLKRSVAPAPDLAIPQKRRVSWDCVLTLGRPPSAVRDQDQLMLSPEARQHTRIQLTAEELSALLDDELQRACYDAPSPPQWMREMAPPSVRALDAGPLEFVSVEEERLPVYHAFSSQERRPVEPYQEWVQWKRIGYGYRGGPPADVAHMRWAPPPLGVAVRGVLIVVRGAGPPKVQVERLHGNGCWYRAYGPHGYYNWAAKHLPPMGIAVLHPMCEAEQGANDLGATVRRILEAYALLRAQLLTCDSDAAAGAGAAKAGDGQVLPALAFPTVGVAIMGWSMGGAAVLEAAAQLPVTTSDAALAFSRSSGGYPSPAGSACPVLELRGVATTAPQSAGERGACASHIAHRHRHRACGSRMMRGE